MQTLLTIVHIVTCFFLILLVLLQSGKGAEISTTLGGSSQTIFGTSGGANFLTRMTSGSAAVFMLTSIGLTVLSGQAGKSVFEGTPIATPSSAPSETLSGSPVPANQGSTSATPLPPASPSATQ